MCGGQLSLEHLPRTLIYNSLQLLPGNCFTQWGLALYSHSLPLHFLSLLCLDYCFPTFVTVCVDLRTHQGCELNYWPHYWDLSEAISWSWKEKKSVSGPSILPQNTSVSFHMSTCPRKQANLGTLRLPLAWSHIFIWVRSLIQSHCSLKRFGKWLFQLFFHLQCLNPLQHLELLQCFFLWFWPIQVIRTSFFFQGLQKLYFLIFRCRVFFLNLVCF